MRLPAGCAKTWEPRTRQIVISPTRAIVRHFDVIPRRLRGMLLMLAATLLFSAWFIVRMQREESPT